jgi:hypothetical protein
VDEEDTMDDDAATEDASSSSFFVVTIVKSFFDWRLSAGSGPPVTSRREAKRGQSEPEGRDDRASR